MLNGIKLILSKVGWAAREDDQITKQRPTKHYGKVGIPSSEDVRWTDKPTVKLKGLAVGKKEKDAPCKKKVKKEQRALTYNPNEPQDPEAISYDEKYNYSDCCSEWSHSLSSDDIETDTDTTAQLVTDEVSDNEPSSIPTDNSPDSYSNDGSESDGDGQTPEDSSETRPVSDSDSGELTEESISTDSDDSNDTDDSTSAGQCPSYETSEDSDVFDLTDSSDPDNNPIIEDEFSTGDDEPIIVPRACASFKQRYLHNSLSSDARFLDQQVEYLPSASKMVSNLVHHMVPENIPGLVPLISAALLGGVMAYLPFATQPTTNPDPQPSRSLTEPFVMSDVNRCKPSCFSPNQPEVTASFTDWFQPIKSSRHLK